MGRSLAIVIPAYNEEGEIEHTVRLVRETNPNAKIIAIDNNSSDKTLEILKRLELEKHLNLSVVANQENIGYGGSVKKGFGLASADADYIAFLDADATYDPKYIPLLVRVLEENNLDCVWSNRFGGLKNEMPLMRKLGNRMISVAFLVTTFKLVPDCTSGERVFTRQALEKIDFTSLPNGMEFITALTKRILSRNLRFQVIPIVYHERKGASKLNVVKDFLKMLKTIGVEK